MSTYDGPPKKNVGVCFGHSLLFLVHQFKYDNRKKNF